MSSHKKYRSALTGFGVSKSTYYRHQNEISSIPEETNPFLTSSQDSIEHNNEIVFREEDYDEVEGEDEQSNLLQQQNNDSNVGQSFDDDMDEVGFSQVGEVDDDGGEPIIRNREEEEYFDEVHEQTDESESGDSGSDSSAEESESDEEYYPPPAPNLVDQNGDSYTFYVENHYFFSTSRFITQKDFTNSYFHYINDHFVEVDSKDFLLFENLLESEFYTFLRIIKKEHRVSGRCMRDFLLLLRYVTQNESVYKSWKSYLRKYNKLKHFKFLYCPLHKYYLVCPDDSCGCPNSQFIQKKSHFPTIFKLRLIYEKYGRDVFLSREEILSASTNGDIADWTNGKLLHNLAERSFRKFGDNNVQFLGSWCDGIDVGSKDELFINLISFLNVRKDLRMKFSFLLINCLVSSPKMFSDSCVRLELLEVNFFQNHGAKVKVEGRIEKENFVIGFKNTDGDMYPTLFNHKENGFCGCMKCLLHGIWIQEQRNVSFVGNGRLRIKYTPSSPGSKGKCQYDEIPIFGTEVWKLLLLDEMHILNSKGVNDKLRVELVGRGDGFPKDSFDSFMSSFHLSTEFGRVIRDCSKVSKAEQNRNMILLLDLFEQHTGRTFDPLIQALAFIQMVVNLKIIPRILMRPFKMACDFVVDEVESRGDLVTMKHHSIKHFPKQLDDFGGFYGMWVLEGNVNSLISKLNYVHDWVNTRSLDLLNTEPDPELDSELKERIRDCGDKYLYSDQKDSSLKLKCNLRVKRRQNGLNDVKEILEQITLSTISDLHVFRQVGAKRPNERIVMFDTFEHAKKKEESQGRLGRVARNNCCVVFKDGGLGIIIDFFLVNFEKVFFRYWVVEKNNNEFKSRKYTISGSVRFNCIGNVDKKVSAFKVYNTNQLLALIK